MKRFALVGSCAGFSDIPVGEASPFIIRRTTVKRCSPRLAARRSVPAPDGRVSVRRRCKQTQAEKNKLTQPYALLIHRTNMDAFATKYRFLDFWDVIIKQQRAERHCSLTRTTHLLVASYLNVLSKFCRLYSFPPSDLMFYPSLVGSGVRVRPESLHRRPGVSLPYAAGSEFRKDSRAERETDAARRQLSCSVDVCTNTYSNTQVTFATIHKTLRYILYIHVNVLDSVHLNKLPQLHHLLSAGRVCFFFFLSHCWLIVCCSLQQLPLMIVIIFMKGKDYGWNACLPSSRCFHHSSSAFSSKGDQICGFSTF